MNPVVAGFADRVPRWAVFEFVGVVVAVGVETAREPILGGNVVADLSPELSDELRKRLSRLSVTDDAMVRENQGVEAMVAYFRDQKDYVEKQRKKLPDRSELQNDNDAIASLIDSTLYKLRFLS